MAKLNSSVNKEELKNDIEALKNASSEAEVDAILAKYQDSVDEMRKANTEEKINDRDTAFNIIQEYANTGLIEIGKWMEETKGNDILWELIGDLDDMYEEYFGETD